jgi:integrase
MLEGEDVMCRLPYLSSYMGHASIEYTAYYIHLIPEHLSESGKAVWNSGIEVPSYEN